jgi:hypothetical protein
VLGAIRKNRSLDLPPDVVVDLGDPRIAAAFRSYAEALQVEANRAALVATSASAVIAAIDWERVAAAFRVQMQAALEAVARDAGAATGFLVDNPYAQAWAKSYAGELVTLVDTQTKRAIGDLTRLALRYGYPPREIARDIRDLIGPNMPQAAHIARLINTWTQDGVPWSEITRRAARETSKAIRYRALMIARTETTAAQANGQEGAWLSARTSGAIPPTAVKTWIATPESPRTSDVCRELHGKLAPLGGTFPSSVLGYGVQAPAAHPNCRSTLGLRYLTPDEYQAAARRYGWSTT